MRIILLQSKIPLFPTRFKNLEPPITRATVWPILSRTTSVRHKKKQQALVTLSGGQDSSIATWILFHTQDYYPCQPRSLHYQHFLQPDALYVKKHCAQLSFWFNWDALYYPASRQYGTEAEAGNWRRTSSFRLSTYYMCSFLFKGQNLTDQHETYEYDHWERRVRFDVVQYNSFDEGLIQIQANWASHPNR